MNLNFFTASYPYNGGEYVIENEISILSEEFNQIKIFSHSSKQNITRQTPKNVCVLNLDELKQSKLSFQYLIIIIYFIIIEFLKSNNKGFYLKKYRKWLSLLKQAAHKSQAIEKQELLLPNSINYSFWLNDWALVLTFLKKRNSIKTFVVRCGGFDIWNERHEGNYLPFRGLVYKYADKIIPNTKKGENYIKSLNVYPNKICYHYLATTDYGIGKFDDNETFTIVSVSNVIPLKRINLIIDILKNVNQNVRWFHFGDGELMNDIKDKAQLLKERHEVKFYGKVSNSEIIDFYKKNTVNLFITTSKSEGLPVTIQEAISFGVPILATNVGGISEIVNDITGVLLDKDFDIKIASDFINNFKNSKFNTLAQRKKIREFWKENFEAKSVYKKFSSYIKSL
jgi:glycosyltransferase involved in cell wall biosynthesis